MTKDYSKFKNEKSPLLRAAFYLVEYSWQVSEQFEELQKLASELVETFEKLKSTLKRIEEQG